MNPDELQSMRARTSQSAAGKTIRSMSWVEDEVHAPYGTLVGYWVIEFTDGSEMSAQLMNELMMVEGLLKPRGSSR